MKATLWLVDSNQLSNFYFTEDALALARELIRKDAYTEAGTIEVTGMCEQDACEEWFDLTNNPSRQSERLTRYGRGRSASVGDIVLVEGEMFVCRSMGWQAL
jgi:hypothetical protein